MNNEWVLGNKLFIADRHIQHLSNMIYALQTFVLNNISKDNEEITLLSDQINKMEIEYKKRQA